MLGRCRVRSVGMGGFSSIFEFLLGLEEAAQRSAALTRPARAPTETLEMVRASCSNEPPSCGPGS